MAKKRKVFGVVPILFGSFFEGSILHVLVFNSDLCMLASGVHLA